MSAASLGRLVRRTLASFSFVVALTQAFCGVCSRDRHDIQQVQKKAYVDVWSHLKLHFQLLVEGLSVFAWAGLNLMQKI